jgi:hypothetical protein
LQLREIEMIFRKDAQKTVSALMSAVISLVMLTACTGTKPQATDIVGTWLIDSSARHVLPPSSAVGCAHFSFSSDTTFVATSVPSTLFSAEPLAGPPVTGRGTWQMSENEGRDQIQLRFLSTDQPEKYGSDHGAQLDIEKRGRRLVLFYYLGDPDEQDRVEFIKQ